MAELIPADRERCQAEKPNGCGPFTMGGVARMERCTEKPKVVLIEKTAGEDGQAGEMSLCGHCLIVFNAQANTPDVAVEVLS